MTFSRDIEIEAERVLISIHKVRSDDIAHRLHCKESEVIRVFEEMGLIHCKTIANIPVWKTKADADSSYQSVADYNCRQSQGMAGAGLGQ